MLKDKYLAKLKTLFFRQGISHRQSQRLLEELQDHLSLKITELKAQGENSADAEHLAIESMGMPEVVAANAAIQLRNDNWLARHPWLTFGVGAFPVSFLLWIAIAWLGYFLSGSYSHDHDHAFKVSTLILQIDVAIFNWMPLLIGMAILWVLIRFSSIGWKTIFIASIFIGIASGVMELSVGFSSVPFSTEPPRLHGHFNPVFSFIFQGWERTGILHSLRVKPLFVLILSLPAIFKLVAPLGVCLFARYIMPYIKSHTPATSLHAEPTVP